MKKVKEPADRIAHRLGCKSIGYAGNCFKKSGWLNNAVHITRACDGDCRRMKIYDTKHGHKGVDFKLADIV